MSMINIGYGNMVSADKIVAVVCPDSEPIKRLVRNARDSGMAIDATYGRKTRAVIVMNSGHVILSSLITDTLAARINCSGGTDNNE